MKLEKIDTGLDGGTIYIYTDEGIFCFDYRCYTNTEGLLYEGYPDDGKVAENKLAEILPLLPSVTIKKLLESRKNNFYTSDVWCLFYPELSIYDPDGWDRHNFNISFYKEKITHDEFMKRLIQSTCMVKNDL